MRTFLSLAVVALFMFESAAAQQPATPVAPGPDQGVGERIGESVERGLNTLGQKIRKTWADIRQSVDELGVQGRVYGRLHWDKALANAPIEIGVENENTVVLSGTVPDEAAHTTAVTLAQSTVGVGKVVDRLTISSTKITTAPPTTTAEPAAPTVPTLDVPKQ